jgi:hypothetical protein
MQICYLNASEMEMLYSFICFWESKVNLFDVQNLKSNYGIRTFRESILRLPFTKEN